MAGKRKRKTLPKIFNELLESDDLSAMQQVFEACELEAYDSAYSKRTALLMPNCPESLARWLVARGANINARDYHGQNALHIAAGSRRSLSLIIELGCDVHACDSSGDTPLHAAADAKDVLAVESLLSAGSEIDAKNHEGLTPLEIGLRGCSNIEIIRMVDVAKVFLAAGAHKTAAMYGFVTRIGKNFEFHRAGFAKDSVRATSRALASLCELFDLKPPERRVMHEGESAIVVGGGSWREQYKRLWQLLVPSKGNAATVQGEVLRISGRISGEIFRNGGGNWDTCFTLMARAFIKHVQDGCALEENIVKELNGIVNVIIRKRGDVDSDDYERLEELAVEWIRRNPKPFNLGRVPYKR